LRLFAKKILFFLLPLLVVSAFLEYQVRKSKSYYSQKINGLIHNLDSINILILGSSYAANGIDPSQFDLYGYNMAFGSQTLYYDSKIIEHYLPKLVNLKYVFISIDYQSLYYPYNASRKLYYHYYYNMDYLDDFYLFEDISRFFFGFRPKHSIDLIFNNKVKRLKNGWLNSDTTYHNKFKKEYILKRARHFNQIIEQNLTAKAAIIEDVESMITALKDRNVIPIIISFPIHTDFRKELDQKILIQNQKDIDYLCDKYDVVHWSYLNYNFGDHEYLDNSHLNKRGSNRLSDSLNIRMRVL